MTPHLRNRAQSLRVQAERVHPVLAQAYRRRAAELSLEAWLMSVRRAPAHIEDFA